MLCTPGTALLALAAILNMMPGSQGSPRSTVNCTFPPLLLQRLYVQTLETQFQLSPLNAENTVNVPGPGATLISYCQGFNENGLHQSNSGTRKQKSKLRKEKARSLSAIHSMSKA